MRRGRGAVWAACAALTAFAAPAFAAPDAIDCAGPAGTAEPGTPAWTQRETREAFCGEQRVFDTAANPLFQASGPQAFAATGGSSLSMEDPLRDPDTLDGHRFRYERVSFPDPKGTVLDARLFRPCDGSCTDVPGGLGRFAAPYPAVVIAHGGSAQQEMYWWGAEMLAEAGYMVLTFQVPTAENTGPASFYGDTSAAIDFLTSTANPHRAELDATRIGLAGHSAGGVAVSRVGQQDPRVSAIVSWDRAQSTTMPADLVLRTPALFFTADYNCQQVPVCVPQPYTEEPDPLGPGTKDEDFRRLRAAGVDTMKIALRAATHLDFTQFGLVGTGSRYGAAVAAYYTLAWFDRYLRPDTLGADALGRLTAATFDDSADVHNISAGQFDPVTQTNVPAMLAGLPTIDRLSFRFRSGWSLDGGAIACDDVRRGC